MGGIKWIIHKVEELSPKYLERHKAGFEGKKGGGREKKERRSCIMMHFEDHKHASFFFSLFPLS